MLKATVVGAGLAGCEAAYQLAKRGIKVSLVEMKPKKYSPAHHLEDFAELVCSNSLRSNALTNAVGLLKEEMRQIGSLIMEAADANAVPAGSALAVDRIGFSKYITESIKSNKNIEIIYEEMQEIPEDPTIIATGPLTSDALAKAIAKLIDEDYFYFYDAAAPIVTLESIDLNKVYRKSRYDKGEADYLNCPMSQEEFMNFYNELINAECAELHEFEDEKYFEGCMPVEEMAKRGLNTLVFGPLKPVGLEKDGYRPYAVVQLRQDNSEGTLFNLVGFQTHLKFPEQKRVFSMIPGLENAEFVRYGVMHRNTFINSPKCLMETYQCIKREDLFFAGQITGVEGYVESISSGFVAGLNAASLYNIYKEENKTNNKDTSGIIKQDEFNKESVVNRLDKKKIVFSNETVIGALSSYISTSNENFQPMNSNFGILPKLDEEIRDKKLRYEKLAKRSLKSLKKRHD